MKAINSLTSIITLQCAILLLPHVKSTADWGAPATPDGATAHPAGVPKHIQKAVLHDHYK